MVIAGEASGDLLAAELVGALRQEFAEAEAIPTADHQPLHASLEPRFFGAGGQGMAAAGVELAFDLTAYSVTGLSDVMKNLFKFQRLLHQLRNLAIERKPDAVICVDFSGFNLRLAHAMRRYVRARRDWFHDWAPKVFQYVSPQVWASREGRAYQMARDMDLLLSIIPFERDWYAKRVPQLRVEFVGHPLLDRYANAQRPKQGGSARGSGPSSFAPHPSPPLILLLPGSRRNELARHLAVMIGALTALRAALPNIRAKMVLPNEELVRQARASGLPPNLEIQYGGLAEALANTQVAIASTGTVTMECAYFGVPTVAIYKTSWSTYQIGKRMARVKYLAMPNLLAGEEVFPEFIQNAATPENLARAALELLRDQSRRERIRSKLAQVIRTLGGPGASRRAARAIISLTASQTPDRDWSRVQS